MNVIRLLIYGNTVSAGCHINDVMNMLMMKQTYDIVSAGCHINDVMNLR